MKKKFVAGLLAFSLSSLSLLTAGPALAGPGPKTRLHRAQLEDPLSAQGHAILGAGQITIQSNLTVGTTISMTTNGYWAIVKIGPTNASTNALAFVSGTITNILDSNINN